MRNRLTKIKDKFQKKKEPVMQPPRIIYREIDNVETIKVELIVPDYEYDTIDSKYINDTLCRKLGERLLPYCVRYESYDPDLRCHRYMITVRVVAGSEGGFSYE